MFPDPVFDFIQKTKDFFDWKKYLSDKIMDVIEAHEKQSNEFKESLQ